MKAVLMKSIHPFLSPQGGVILLVLTLFMGAILTTQKAWAFNPGDLSAKSQPGVELEGYQTHAAFEDQCAFCHDPLVADQGELCLDCHQEIAAQIAEQRSVHGKLPEVSECRLCHSDHQGRDFDPTRTARLAFDHSLTNFNLIWHQVDYDASPMMCGACHAEQTDFEFISASCADCHAAQSPEFMAQHQQDFGSLCLDCHDGSGRLSDFDHIQTNFPLDGLHLEVNCAGCHLDGQFAGLDTQCAACHVESPLHAGVFIQDCVNCHLTTGWRPAFLDGQPFDHHVDTGFSLEKHPIGFTGLALACLACHGDTLETQTRDLVFDQTSCIDCHTGATPDFMAEHQAQFGRVCLDCHDGSGRLANFDHASAFVLDGRHAELDCQACHGGGVYRGTPTDCVGCHAEPEIHAGWFGLDCQNCHSTTGWRPASLVFHSFPLDHGGQGEVACDVCHFENRYIEYTCYGCHEHQPGPIAEEHLDEGISTTDLIDCVACHPNGLKDEAEDRNE